MRRIDGICDWLETRIEKKFVVLGAIVRNARLQWRREARPTGVTEHNAIPDWAYHWPDCRGKHKDLVEKA